MVRFPEIQDVPHVIRVRVCAPMPARISRMMQRMAVDDAEVARREIERSDTAHTRVTRKFFDVDWRDPINYHMVLNTAEVPVDACIDQVRLLVDNPAFAASEASRGAIADKIIEARIRAKLDDSSTLGVNGRSFDIEVKDGKVILAGFASSRDQIDGVVGMLGDMDGVMDVQHDILLMPTTPMV